MLTSLRTPNVGPAKIEAVEAHERAWAKVVADAAPPFGPVAALLCERVGICEPVELGGAKLQDPFLLMALGAMVATFGGPWWKTLLSAHRIVP